MRLSFLSEQFEHSFELEGSLLRFAQPGRAQRLQPGKIIGSDLVSEARRIGKDEQFFGRSIQFPCLCQTTLRLKGLERGPGLRPDEAVD